MSRVDRVGGDTIDGAGNDATHPAGKLFGVTVDAELNKGQIVLAQAQPLRVPDSPGERLPVRPDPSTRPNPSAKILPFRQPGAVGGAEAASARATSILGLARRFGPTLAVPLTLYGDTPRHKDFEINHRSDFFAQTDRESGSLIVKQRTGFWSPDNELAELESKWSPERNKWVVLGAENQVIGTFETLENGHKVVEFEPEALEALDIRATVIGDDKKTAPTGAVEAPEAEPAPAPQEERCEESRGVGQTIKPSGHDIWRLTNGTPGLTYAAANAIVERTQPQGTTAEIVGKTIPGPDIYYRYPENECDESGQSRGPKTVRVETVNDWKGFNTALREELQNKRELQSHILAVQVPVGSGPGRWMEARDHAFRVLDRHETGAAADFTNHQILFVDTKGRILFEGPAFKAK